SGYYEAGGIIERSPIPGLVLSLNAPVVRDALDQALGLARFEPVPGRDFVQNQMLKFGIGRYFDMVARRIGNSAPPEAGTDRSPGDWLKHWHIGRRQIDHEV